MRRALALGLLVAALLAAAPTRADEPALLDSDAVLLERLELHRQLLDERLRRLQAEYLLTEALRAQAGTALEIAVRNAADRARVDPATMRPDVATRTWKAR